MSTSTSPSKAPVAAVRRPVVTALAIAVAVALPWACGPQDEAPSPTPAAGAAQPAPPAVRPATAGPAAPPRAARERLAGRELLRDLYQEDIYDPIHPFVRVQMKDRIDAPFATSVQAFLDDSRRVRETAAQLLERVRGLSDPSIEDLEQGYLPEASAASRDGDARLAAELYDEWYARLVAIAPEHPSTRVLLGCRALAWQRVGEVENCIAVAAPGCCTLPLNEAGLHSAREGSERAVELWIEHLEEQPANLTAQWLLNVAAMTLDRWPDAVPERWRIGADKLASEHQLPAFREVAAELGIDVLSCSGGVIVEDFDGDADLDVVFSDWYPSGRMRYFANVGGRFEDRTEQAGLVEHVGGLNMTHADYDSDGDEDILLARGAWGGPQRNALLRNDGAGVFVDVTEAVGLAFPMMPCLTVPWADVDRDGDLDLFVGVESAEGGEPWQLFQNDEGRFRDVADESGVALTGLVKGAAFGDVNGDGAPELYVSVFGGENVLFDNRGDGRFVRRADSGMEEPWQSFPTWFFDYDQDGQLDVFVACYEYSVDVLVHDLVTGETDGETSRLYRNVDGRAFADVTREVGLDRSHAVMGAGFGDLDNDGFPEIYLGTGSPSYACLTPNVLYWNDGGKRFLDATASSRTGHLQKGHGVAFGDLDDDGDLDIVVELGGAKIGDAFVNAVYENPGTPGRHWLDVELVGVRTNPAGIGCRVVADLVLAPDAAAPTRRFAWMGGEGSFGSGPSRVHLGLGECLSIRSLEVTWPVSGAVQRFEDVPLDSLVRIREEGALVVLSRGEG